MNEDFSTDLITLIDDQGVEHEFEILDVIDNSKGCFYAVVPVAETPEAFVESEGVYYIFEEIDVDGEKQLAEVEDEELLNELAQEFESHFDDLYIDEE